MSAAVFAALFAAHQVADRWLPGFDTDHLIDTAEHHAGIPFAPLSAVRASKRVTARPKDRPDLALIDTALARRAA